MGFSVPRAGGQGGLKLQVPEVPAMHGQTYQECVVRLPVRLTGWGYRSLKETCGPAYLGTLETALPYMAGLGNICPQLAELWGGRECWGESADKEQRWRTVLESNCSDGIELATTYTGLKLEATTASHYLGQDLPLVFQPAVAGVGGDSTSGETRTELVTALENLRAKVLGKVLKKVRPKSTREAWAWRQRDKVSSAWVLAIPGYQSTLTSAEFSLAAATNLCIPPPVCLEREGETIKGNVTIDCHGDRIQATCIEGDHWRRRHDLLVQLTHQMCLWAGVSCDMEVFNLFQGVVCQAALSRMERAQQRQTLVPDLRITVPPLTVVVGGRGVNLGEEVEDGDSQEEQGEEPVAPAAVWAGRFTRVAPILHEVKCISSNGSRYKPTWKKRAVDVRASKLPEEYRTKAATADRRHNGVEEGEVGGCEQRLTDLGSCRGLVAGNFGEVSDHWHQLLTALATNRVQVAGVQRGRRGLLRSEDAERAVATSILRKRLGVATVKAQTMSMLGRLEVLGPGAGAARGRRRQAAQLEHRWGQEQRAADLAQRQGWRAHQSGYRKLD